MARGVFARRLEGIEARSERVRALVIATLARAPTAREQAALEAYVAARDDAPEAYEDVLWALIATTEFSTQH